MTEAKDWQGYLVQSEWRLSFHSFILEIERKVCFWL